jgi:ADP-heptose:LPS heptosyltransferase
MAPRFTHPAADQGAPIHWPGVRRVLLVRPDNLGDVVMLTPALRALRRAAPGAELHLLASPVGSGLAPTLPGLDGVLTVSPVWQDTSGGPAQDPDREARLVETLRAGRYDAMLVFTSFSQSPWPAAYAGYLAGIPVRAGLSKEFGGSLLSHWVTPPPDELHQVDRCLHLLAALGVPGAGHHLELNVPEAAREQARDVLARLGLRADGRFAMLAPGASCPARRYPAERFGRAAAEIAAAGLPVVVTGSEREAALVEQVVAAAGRTGVVPAVGLEVPAFVALTAAAAVAVVNDSGGLHVADAVGTPVVCAFSGTELESQLRPRTAPSVLLRIPTACSPCHQFRCPYALECLDIGPDRLSSAAVELAGIRSAVGV